MIPQHKRLDYSLRRYFVDEFHFRHVPDLPPDSRVLDLGGNKTNKRGQFDLEKYNLCVVYSNLSIVKSPDVQADAAYIPFADNSFDVVICSELLEHVPNPPDVLSEVYRVLRPGGLLLICVPFLYQIHSDPYDFGRYTDYYWSVTLGKIGYRETVIEKQGLFWSVLVGFLTAWVIELDQKKPLRLRKAIIGLAAQAKRTAIKWDADDYHRNHPFFSSFTTGFGIRAKKG
ncbi:MAG: class I SAM-dependent methyltransferase [Thermoplasmata archaeon]|nr:class I SAM-dependent methyltransferase [Thermoplasmata archaeon]